MKKIFVILMVTLVCVPSLFATRVNIPYGNDTYMFDTAKTLSQDSTYYLQGVYDGITQALRGDTLKDIHLWLTTVRFPEGTLETDMSDYRDGFMDIMANHTRTTMGSWSDIWPLYRDALEGTTYEDALTAVTYGQARFFLSLEPLNVVNVTRN